MCFYLGSLQKRTISCFAASHLAWCPSISHTPFFFFFWIIGQTSCIYFSQQKLSAYWQVQWQSYPNSQHLLDNSLKKEQVWPHKELQDMLTAVLFLCPTHFPTATSQKRLAEIEGAEARERFGAPVPAPHWAEGWVTAAGQEAPSVYTPRSSSHCRSAAVATLVQAHSPYISDFRAWLDSIIPASLTHLLLPGWAACSPW